jgi:hypothetical protein
MVFGVLGHPFQQFAAQVLVRHLAPSKAQCDLHLVSVLEKLENVAHFDIIVIDISIGTEFDFLDLDYFLLLTSFALAFLLLVFKLSEIHDLTDRWIGVRRDFDQVEPSIFGHHNGAGGRHDANVLSFSANQADFGGVDFIVYARASVSLWRRVMGSASDGGDPLIVAKFEAKT